MATAHDHRVYLARKMWRSPFSGWTAPWWTTSKKDDAAFKYWRKHELIEEDSGMMRLTEKGRHLYEQQDR